MNPRDPDHGPDVAEMTIAVGLRLQNTPIISPLDTLVPIDGAP